MWWPFQALISSLFLLSIILSIPIAFDVGGRDSGLAYSLSLFGYYLFYSSAKLATSGDSTPRPIRFSVSTALQLSQWIIIPTLLIWALGKFAIDADGGASWVERTLATVTSSRVPAVSWRDWIFGKDGLLETVALGSWDSVLRYSSPVFQLLEGFCALLVIQAAGQITRWLVNRGRSDTWMIVLLIFSGSIIASAVYFLWRVARFPQISNLDATLIGITMTSALFLCALGIGSGRSNPVESSLLFAYVVLCVYQIFTDYLPSSDRTAADDAASTAIPDPPPLPPIIMASLLTLVQVLGSLPSAVYTSLALLYAAFQTITPSVIISIAFRIFVFYSATRIIPAVRESGARALMLEPSFEDADAANRVLGFLSWFSPSILIAVYTSLLLQHFSTSDGPDGWTLRAGNVGGNAWRWVNIAATVVLYGVELYLGSDDPHHWKVD